MKRIYSRLIEGETHLAAFCFTACATLIFISAVMRAIGYPINWAWDISLFLFAWSVFLSADSALRHDRLVVVDLVIMRIPERWRTIFAILNYVLILAFLAALIVYGFIMSYVTRSRAFQGIPAISYTWVTLSVPIGSILLFITAAGKFKNAAQKFFRKDAA